MTLRVAIYARFSDLKQNAASVEDQIRMGQLHSATEGWAVVGIYSDAAISGSLMQRRSGVQDLMRDAKARKFDMLVIESLERASRDPEHLERIYKLMKFYEIPIFSLETKRIANRMDVAFKGLMSADFLESLAYKTRRGQRGRVEKGKSGGGKVYGYDTVRAFDANGERIKGERTINEQEAAVVRRIFEDYANGKSPRRIAAELNKEGIRSPYGKGWANVSITGSLQKTSGILNQELYIGTIVWNKTRRVLNPMTERYVSRVNPKEEWVRSDVPELRILEQELWDKVKAIQKTHEKKSAPHLSRRAKTLFSNLLKCGCCGAAFSMISAKRYGCSGARNKGTCKNRMTIAKAKIENTVLDALQGQIMRPELFKVFCDEFTAHMDKIMQKTNEHFTLAKAKLKKLEQEKANIMQSIRDGIPASLVKDELLKVECEHEETALIVAAGAIKPIPIEADMADIYHETLKNLREDLNNDATREEASERIRTLVDKVIIQPNEYGTQLQLTLHGDLAGMLALAGNTELPDALQLGLDDEVATPPPASLQYQLTTAPDITL